jgi:3-methyladenine DNA glycosylase/8-oxoguanine DNA glycosylase
VIAAPVRLEAVLRPVSPFSLERSARGASGACRHMRGGVLELAFELDGAPHLGRVRQRPDGALEVVVDGAQPGRGLEAVRFALGCDDDIGPFLERAGRDPLLRDVVVRCRGLRPLRVATVAHALVQAFCGQLVESSVARVLERRVVALVSPRHGELRLPPRREALAACAPARLAALGLAPRRAAARVGACRRDDLERLRSLPTADAVARLQREPQVGPWSAGVVALAGLGRYEQAIVGDLGLVRLLGALRGRRVEAAETRELVEPYGEWAGLAGLYLLSHPLAQAPRRGPRSAHRLPA